MITGIVLGGGGTKTFAHLGVLKALDEAGIRPDILSCASAGTIMGAFIASGFTPEETLELMKTYRLMDYVRITLPLTGLFTLNNLEKNLQKQLPARTFADLKIPLQVSVLNLNNGKVEYLHSGPLIPAIKAACAIPFIFSPVKLNGQLYVDGGLLDNIPYVPLLHRCDRIITISATRTGITQRINNIKAITERAIELLMNQDCENAKRYSDIYIEPVGTEDYSMMDTRHGGELFRIGYDYTKKLLHI